MFPCETKTVYYQTKSFKAGYSKWLPSIACNKFLATIPADHINRIIVLPPGKNDSGEPLYIVIYRTKTPEPHPEDHQS